MSNYRVGLMMPVVGCGPALEKRDYQVGIGGPLWHTVGDRVDAVKKMNTEFAQVLNEAMAQMGWTETTPNAVEKDPRWAWYKSVVVPFANEWQAFQAKVLGSWTSRFTTDWDTIENWQRRMQAMRNTVAAKFTVSSPEPGALPQTIWQNTYGAGADFMGGIFRLVKNVLYVVLFMVGGYLLYKAFVVSRGGSGHLIGGA